MCIMCDEARVFGTKIFSRLSRRGENVLLYQMGVESKHELAMVLPISRREGGRFKFVDFTGYSRIFEQLEKLFPDLSDGDDLFGGLTLAAGPESPLPVEKIGSFDASFVPTLADFDRVDARFRLKPGIWEKLPAYQSWSFAVFQLRKGRHKVHPMGLAFETRFTGKCFFPTVHVHDGELHSEADFDHLLYTQGIAAAGDWEEASVATSVHIGVDETHGFVRPGPVYRRTIVGRRRNADVWAPIAA